MKSESNAEGLGREFTIVREVAAPRELVWRACTEPAHLAQWWGPKGFSAPVCEWEARPGGRIFVVMRGCGQDHRMGGECLEAVPPEKLVTITGALDEAGQFRFKILHTLTLVALGKKTRLTMHSKVIAVTPGAGQFIGGFEMGMTLSLERLDEHLAQKTEPFVIERTFEAPVALVWRALIDPAAIKDWFFELEHFRPEVGCEFGFTVEHQGQTFVHRCRVAEVQSQQRLAYSWGYEGQAGDSLVVIDLYAEGGKTRLRLTHLGLETFPALPWFARENFQRGWTSLVGTDLPQWLAKQP
jgi:uncharacterized protein YndB with AHSA1/START domain